MSKPSSPTTWTSKVRSTTQPMARWIATAGLAALILTPAITSVRAEAVRMLPTELYPAPLSATAASKLDPRLVMALARPNDSEAMMRALGGQIAMRGTSMQDLEYPIIVKTELSDAELAAMGAFPNSRIGSFVTTQVSEDVLKRLGDHPGIEGVEAGYRLTSTLDISIPEVRANLVNTGANAVTGNGVLYGLMDDGIDITHADFMNGGSSRIQFVWDQFETQFPDPPSGFDYGAEYTKAEIDGGQATRFKNAGGHGSHVAGISASNHGTYRGVAYEADIVAVVNGGCDLFCYGGGTAVFGPQTTVGSIDGLNYMKQKATQLGMPLVVNQSQGVTMGPHDGSTFFESAYNDLVASQDMIICVAAGNDQTAGWHGRQTVAANNQVTFQMTHDTSQAQPLPVIWFEVWYNAGQQFSFQITTPSSEGLEIPAETGDGGAGGTSGHGDSVGAFATTSHPSNGQGYLWVQLLNQNQGVEAGTWQLSVISQSGSAGAVDLYCERNQHNFTINPSQVSNTAIVGMPGSASGVITVGSYNTRIEWDSIGGNGVNDPNENPVNMISTFSSNGPLRNGVQKPDLSAPGAYIASAMSIDFAPNQNPLLIAKDNQHTFFNGTSMATPHVSGAIALMLEKDPTLTPAQAKQILTDTARTDGFTGSVPNGMYGHGKLDVAAAVNAVGGNNNGCLTAAGDANGSTSVNVLDVVAVVNHVLGISTLSAEAQACADITGEGTVNSSDIPGIIDIILAGAPRVPARAPAPATAEWSQSTRDGVVEIQISGAASHALEMVFNLPRGYRMRGEPTLRGAAAEINAAWQENLKQYKLVAYDLSGEGLSSASEPLSIEIPVVREYYEEELDTFAVSRVVLSDAFGRPVGLVDTPVDGSPGSGPSVLPLEAEASPNPLRVTSKVAYALPLAGEVEVAVFDASGRRVRVLAEGWQAAGPHSVNWDGRDEAGNRVAEGVYFARVQTESGNEVAKITVVR